MLLGLSLVVLGILSMSCAVYVNEKGWGGNKLTTKLYGNDFESWAFVGGLLPLGFGLLITLTSFNQEPPCKVTKQAYDIDQYEYVLSGSKVSELRSKDKRDLKMFLDTCSQIQRKQKWLEEHDEVETLMEVK